MSNFGNNSKHVVLIIHLISTRNNFCGKYICERGRDKEKKERTGKKEKLKKKNLTELVI